MMIADKKTVELAEADEALRRSLASLTNADDLWPFVTGVLSDSAQAISARSAAIFLLDDRSNRMRTAIGSNGYRDARLCNGTRGAMAQARP